MLVRNPKPFFLYAPEAPVSWSRFAAAARDENPAALCRKKWQAGQGYPSELRTISASATISRLTRRSPGFQDGESRGAHLVYRYQPTATQIR